MPHTANHSHRLRGGGGRVRALHLSAPPPSHKATTGGTRRDDNYLHGSRCLQVSPESDVPSAMRKETQRVRARPSAWHTVLMAPGAPFCLLCRAGEQQKGIEAPCGNPGEGTVWISEFCKGNQDPLEIPCVHKLLLPPDRRQNASERDQQCSKQAGCISPCPVPLQSELLQGGSKKGSAALQQCLLTALFERDKTSLAVIVKSCLPLLHSSAMIRPAAPARAQPTGHEHSPGKTDRQLYLD